MKKLFVSLIFMCCLLALAVPAFAASSVTLNEHSIMFFVSDGKIGFQEALTYNNPNGQSIRVTLPKGAEEVSSASAAGTVSLKKSDFIESASGLETSIKVPKGTDMIELRYFVKPTGNGFDYVTKINYETQKIKLLSTGDVVPFGHQLGQLPREKASSGFYEVPINPLKVGEILQVRLAADPNALSGKAPAPTGKKGELPGQQGTTAQPPVRSSASGALVYILIFVLVILLTIAGYYFLRMRRQS